MGRSLVFKGVEITNPIGQVTFVDGIPQQVLDYLQTAGITATDFQKKALGRFYQTLDINGLLEHAKGIYPLFGGVSACPYPLVGNDLMSIPTVCEYDKGLNLENASGGRGYYGRGISFYGNIQLDNSTIYFVIPEGTEAFCPMTISLMDNGTIDNDCYGSNQAIGKNCYGLEGDSDGNGTTAKWLNGANVAVPVGSKVFAFMHSYDGSNAEHYIYIDGEQKAHTSGAIGGIGKNVGINTYSAASVANYEVRARAKQTVAFAMCFQEAHTAEQVAIVTEALEKVCARLFI